MYARDSKEHIALSLLDNIESPFAQYEVVMEGDQVKDLRLYWANKSYLLAVSYTCNGEAIGNVFSAIAPEDAAWIPVYGDIALGKTPGRSFESYVEIDKMFISLQAYSPQPGHVATVIHKRLRSVAPGLEKDKSDVKLMAMIDSIPEGIMYGRLIVDETSGQPTDIFCSYVNPTLEIYEGVAVGSVTGKNFYELYPHSFKEDLHKCLEALQNKQKVTYIKEGAANRAIEVSIYPQGNMQVFIVMRDVTVKENAKKAFHDAHQKLMESINYASKIQKNLLPKENVFQKAFSDYSIIWKPQDIVGGDIYWAKNFKDGTVLCVCDCTGHGTPGALLTTLVVSVFENAVTEENHQDTAQILFTLDKRLANILNIEAHQKATRSIMDIGEGCDLAVLYVSKSGDITMSAGKIHVFVCDGERVVQHKGQQIFVGEGNLASKDAVAVNHIPASPNSKFYIASDGLFKQKGGTKNRQFGYNIFKEIIKEHHHEGQTAINEQIWDAFEAYRGSHSRRDDLILFSFKP